MLPGRIVTVEVAETESLVLVLSESEREALLRVLYVVKDNFWLDDIEQELLERLVEPRRRSFAKDSTHERAWARDLPPPGLASCPAPAQPLSGSALVNAITRTRGRTVRSLPQHRPH